MSSDLEDKIAQNRQEIKADRMDMSLGEIMNMCEDDEIRISPGYQRAFRWDVGHQTRFIESILLGIPFPPIFVAEDEHNVWELVDGLQRVSTVLSFFGKLGDERKNHLRLVRGGIIEELEGITIDTLPLKYKLLIKRAVCRVEIVRLDGGFNMKYELFKRLNTGGLTLSPQEIRSCVFGMDDDGFNAFLTKLASDTSFQKIVNIGVSDKEQMSYEELVLRYLSLKNKKGGWGQDMQQHLDNYMEDVVGHGNEFDYKAERDLFSRIVNILRQTKGDMFRTSGLSFSAGTYDPIMLTFAEHVDFFENIEIEEIDRIVEDMKKDSGFKKNAGSESSSQSEINAKIEIMKKYFGIKQS